jgi:hypothetical protein
MDTEVLPMDRLARIYLKIRTAIAEKNQQLNELEEQRKTVANAMKDQLQAAHVSSMRTEFGTVTLMQKTRFWSADWEEFEKFCLQQRTIAFLEKRIVSSTMTKFLEANPGLVPPGLNSDSEYVVSVRKSA